MNWANLLLAGAPKSGCTSLKNLLESHPKIRFLPEKDLPVFTKKANLTRFESYSQKFVELSEANPSVEYIGDFNPAYFFIDRTPERLFEYLGQRQIVFLLRDPVDRTISHFWHKKKKFEDGRSIDEVFKFSSKSLSEVINEEKKQIRRAIDRGKIDSSDARARYDSAAAPFQYVQVSNYRHHLKRFFNYFEKENILILHTNRLQDDPEFVLKRVFKFLDLDPIYPDCLNEKYNETRVPSNDPVSKLLHNFFKPMVPGFLKEFKWLQSLYNRLAFKPKPVVSDEIHTRLRNIFKPELDDWDVIKKEEFC
jgi:hypothetical protein